jgi:hypothetical protein
MHGKELLTFLLMFGVDPPLRFARLLVLLLPKLSCNQDKTLRMHATFLLEGYKLSINYTNHR